MRELSIDTGRKSYPVHIGRGLLEGAGDTAAALTGPSKAAIVTDDNVAGLYLERLALSLKGAGFEVACHVLPNGEASKNTQEYLKIIDFLSDNRLSGTDAVFALGGGVVGDIAGFAAATYLRGVRLMQVPTTLLSAVDSSVGGKTAVNLASGKNQLGTFYQPDLVICDTETLETLPEEIFRDGCAEVIKYGVIADKKLFYMLKETMRERMEEIIERSLAIKGRLVMEDELDKGPRHLLNFGHTFGHAIEKCSGYKISHGKAVAAGMVMAAYAAERLEICDAGCRSDIEEMVRAFGLPAGTDFEEKELFDAMISDKKRDRDEITLVLPEEIGRCVLRKFPTVELPLILRASAERRRSQ